MNGLNMILLWAILLEALLQVAKSWVPETVSVSSLTWPLVSAALGMVLCLAADVDVFETFGITLKVPYIGPFMSGVIISRGSNFVHDLWQRVNVLKEAEPSTHPDNTKA